MARQARIEYPGAIHPVMSNHFHLVVETPEANLGEGMHWFLSTYTIRLNKRQALSGHVFSGRFKPLIVEGSGNGYLRAACDYVHLNPVRAALLQPGEAVAAYSRSRLLWYAAAPQHGPGWIRVNRLLGEHGIQQDTPEGRALFQNVRCHAWMRGETPPRWASQPNLKI